MHPDLARLDRRNRWGVAFFGLSGLGVLAATFWHGLPSGRRETAEGVLHAAIAALLLWCAWFIGQGSRWYARVDGMLRSTNATPMRIAFSRNERGTPQALLHDLSDVRLAHPRIRFLFAAPGWDYQPLAGQVVRARIAPEQGGPVVVETPSGILWPLERVRREDLRQPAPDLASR